MKKTVTTTVPSFKWVVEDLCAKCTASCERVSLPEGTPETDTMPLRVEKLFQEYNNPGSFAVASVLTLMALATLGVRLLLERWAEYQIQSITSEQEEAFEMADQVVVMNQGRIEQIGTPQEVFDHPVCASTVCASLHAGT